MRTLFITIGLVLLTGCNVCEDLDTRMCTDLGAEACETWKAQGMNFTAQAKTRPRNALKALFFGADAQTCQSAGSSTVYPTILDSTKKALGASKTPHL